MVARNNDIVSEANGELMRSGNFLRIYPSKGSWFYDKFFRTPRKANRALYTALYGNVPFPSRTGHVPDYYTMDSAAALLHHSSIKTVKSSMDTEATSTVNQSFTESSDTTATT
jgi:hypothetical protein